MDGPPIRHPKVVSFQRGSSPSRLNLDIVNESSPLIRPRSSSEVEDQWRDISPIESEEDYFLDDDPDEETKSSWYLVLLTLGGLGLQIGWSVETSNGSVSTHWTSSPTHLLT